MLFFSFPFFRFFYWFFLLLICIFSFFHFFDFLTVILGKTLVSNSLFNKNLIKRLWDRFLLLRSFSDRPIEIVTDRPIDRLFVLEFSLEFSRSFRNFSEFFGILWKQNVRKILKKTKENSPLKRYTQRRIWKWKLKLDYKIGNYKWIKICIDLFPFNSILKF